MNIFFDVYFLFSLEISAKVWQLYHTDIFDYSSNTAIASTTRILDSSVISMDQSSKIVSDSIYRLEEGSPMFEVSVSQNSRSISQEAEKYKQVGNIWYPVKMNRDKPLSKGDFVKFGKIIIEISDNQSPGEEAGSPEIDSSRILNDFICKICLSSFNFDENPLISPCRCSGSLKYIHFHCLKTWMEFRVKRSSKVLSYSKEDLTCELCSSPFATNFIVNGINRHIIGIQHGHSLRLEEYFGSRTYIVSLKEAEFVTIGRKKDSDIPLKDKSISRLHAKLTYRNGRYFLEDKDSRFGTSILIDDHFPIHHNLTLQVSGALFTFKKRQRLRCCKERKRDKCPSRTQIYLKVAPTDESGILSKNLN